MGFFYEKQHVAMHCPKCLRKFPSSVTFSFPEVRPEECDKCGARLAPLGQQAFYLLRVRGTDLRLRPYSILGIPLLILSGACYLLGFATLVWLAYLIVDGAASAVTTAVERVYPTYGWVGDFLVFIGVIFAVYDAYWIVIWVRTKIKETREN